MPFSSLAHLFFSGLFLSTVLFYGCAVHPNKPLKNTYWVLTQMHDEDSQKFEHQPAVHIVFHLNDNTFHGSDGCNRINGSYKKDKNNFTIAKIVSTRMMCQQGMKQAHLFLQTLTKTDRIKIKEDEMVLYSKDVEVARFEAIVK